MDGQAGDHTGNRVDGRGARRLLALAWLAGLALLATLLSACGGGATGLEASTPTPGATPLASALATPPPLAPAAPLVWRRAQAPGPLTSLDALTPAPSEPTLAYACAPLPSGAVQVWVTRDAGATWRTAGDFAVGERVDTCSVVVDMTTPTTLIVMTFHDAHDNCMACGDGDYHRFLSRDGGQSWAPFAGIDDLVTALATEGGATYALFRPHAADLAPLQTELAVSDDGLRTWRHIDGALHAQATQESGGGPTLGRYVTSFWLDAPTGRLLVETNTQMIRTTDFAESADGGATWRMIQTPAADAYVVAPSLGAPWRICGSFSSSGTGIPVPTSALTCTFDGGKTWVGEGAPSDNYIPFALAADGSALSIGFASNTATQGLLSRLAPHGQALEGLGSAPVVFQPWFTYVGAADAGVIWEEPQNVNGPPSQTLYTAAYV